MTIHIAPRRGDDLLWDWRIAHKFKIKDRSKFLYCKRLLEQINYTDDIVVGIIKKNVLNTFVISGSSPFIVMYNTKARSTARFSGQDLERYHICTGLQVALHYLESLKEDLIQ